MVGLSELLKKNQRSPHVALLSRTLNDCWILTTPTTLGLGVAPYYSHHPSHHRTRNEQCDLPFCHVVPLLPHVELAEHPHGLHGHPQLQELASGFRTP